MVLQSFLHNPLLRNYYLSDGHHSGSCMVPSCLSCAMDTTFQDFYAVENTNGYTAAAILSSFWFSDRKAFSNLVTTREQDAHEFFQFLAEELHERNGGGQQASNGEANGRPRSSSQGNDQAPSQSTTGSEHNCNCIIHQTFYGKLQRSTTCMTCHGVTNTVESFLDLSLGFDQVAKKNKKSTGAKGGTSSGAISLKDCLDDEYIKPTQCEYRCHKCNATRQARRSTSIKLLPNVLSIQLKRFEFRQGKRGGDRVASKVDREVQFPLQLNMMPYTSRAKAAAASQQHQQDGSSGPVRDTTYELARSCTYDLLSVVVHVGSIETGHYISYCRMGDQVSNHNNPQTPNTSFHLKYPGE